jgi:single-strand DNA-binding protein
MVNKVILIGRLGKDPETKVINSDVSVTNFTLCTSEKYKNDTGNMVEKVEWHNIVAWRKLAEICSKYLKKGSLIYLEGKLVTDQYEKDGVKHFATKIHMQELKMISTGNKDGQPAADTLQPGVNVPGSSKDDDMPF